MMPEFWTPEHVATRLVEAFQTLDALPERDGHRLIRSVLGKMVAPAPDRRKKPTPRQVSNMEAILHWPAAYLQEFEPLSRLTQRCALLQSRGLNIDAIAELMDLSAADLAEEYEAGCSLVAYGLRQRGVSIF